MRLLVVLAVSASALVMPRAVAAETQHVHIDGISFDPDTVAILPGDTLEWDNHTSVVHTVTDRACSEGDSCLFDIELSTGQTFAHTFDDPGIVRYRCRIHGFSASIVIEDQPGTLPDLAIQAVSVQLTTLFGAPNPTATAIEVTIENVGDASSDATDLSLEYRYRNRWWPIRDLMVEELGPGSTITLRALWDTTTLFGDFTVRAMVDPAGSLDELRTANNEATAMASLTTPPGALPGLDISAPLG